MNSNFDLYTLLKLFYSGFEAEVFIKLIYCSMSEENHRQGENYLQTVIQCLTQRQSHQNDNANEGLNALYGRAEGMIQELDKGISMCKRYNEAKINRKYEIIINDLQAEITKLKHHLALEQKSRSPSKKHVSDLLQKMVAFKLENETLTKENHQLKNRVKILEEQLAHRTTTLSEIQMQHSKSVNDKLPPIHSSPLAEAVREFLREKQNARKPAKGPLSAIQKLLLQLKPKVFTLSLGEFLEELDRWGQTGRDRVNHELDSERIRSGIARRFLDIVDQPQALLKHKGKEDGLWQRLQAKHRQQRRFSHLGSKKSLNASFH